MFTEPTLEEAGDAVTPSGAFHKVPGSAGRHANLQNSNLEVLSGLDLLILGLKKRRRKGFDGTSKRRHTHIDQSLSTSSSSAQSIPV